MIAEKRIPLNEQALQALLAQYPTPFYLYDEAGIRASVAALNHAFAWSPGFLNYFAVKATPNPHILRIIADAGSGLDCSSLPELILAERTNVGGARVMFTSNNTPAEEFHAASRLGAIINLDDVGHLDLLAQEVGLPDQISFRYNPGPARDGNAIIGKPIESKFGCTYAQLCTGYLRAREHGVRRFGIHTMLASNERDTSYFVTTARMIFTVINRLRSEHGITIDFANLGGGIGIPYRPEEAPANLGQIAAGIRAAYDELIAPFQERPLTLMYECGRLITGPHGYLVTRVRHIKETYRTYAGVDACMADLMRPGMYGVYHHITAPCCGDAPHSLRYDVTGSLCENNDKFAIDRKLPPLTRGDVLVIHDVGAHGRAMGFNYNGKLRPAELLLQSDGAIRLIRRAETIEDYFATLV